MQHKGNYVALRTPRSLESRAFFRFECNHKEIFVMRLIELTWQVSLNRLGLCSKIIKEHHRGDIK